MRVAVIGTSWWADTMYLPPLDAHPQASVVAACGRDLGRAEAFATAWNIPHVFTDVESMFDEVELDAVVIATANDSHHDLALAAISRGLHVLCEKPLAMNVAQAEAMAAAATEAGVHTHVPFTYRWMPAVRWARRLIADGYVGTPHHINLRYYTEFGFDRAYSWRFDREIAGSGVLGDLGTHWIDLARWLIDDAEVSVGAVTSNVISERAPRPDGSTYDQTEDSAVMTVRYAGGAYGVLQVSAMCWEGTPFGQTHHIEIHGDEGTLYVYNDWDTVQQVRGLRRGETGPAAELAIPDDVWGGVRRDTVHNTYRDVFRTTDAMTRAWISGIAADTPAGPDFGDGLAVQRVLDAAIRSAGEDGRQIPV